MTGPAPIQRTSLQLFRDCLRLVRHIAPGSSQKAVALRSTVRSEFEKGRYEKDEAKILSLKAGAVRALSNYMLYESGTKDARLGKAMDTFNKNTIKDNGATKHPEESSTGIDNKKKSLPFTAIETK
mmetsp:Transcript_49267/g.73328  ORF Transcript_49267/g.73328 Transcript_49267/m.73328 type:complete len:126 (+) Transcript_49267:233-610(+)|eukprot:CAMPEP_0195521134 /NCGR_PEP_ID=MMETSP0794_2-20130614/18086_1 /TAXON_ID=515487 /ORGANISM="Stephanopyxis turris, Strain CCMP 815" /LENGTH=125 /DNA_ID=CAMNT_0040650629 /DNA_START=209 /DNA_END=586 /DNA_ORIENTATION=+